MPTDPRSVDALLARASLPPISSVDVDGLWRRGRRRRATQLSIAGAAVVVAVATTLGIVVANARHNTQPIKPAPTSPTSSPSAALQTPNPALCTPAAAQARLETFVAEFNAGDPHLVDDSIATESRLRFVQLPSFVTPTPPTTTRQGLTPYFQQLHTQGDRLTFVSITAGPIDSSGDRDFGYQLLLITGPGQRQPAGGTGSVECYAGKIAALYLAW